jgi:hypothetical protein
METEMSNEIDYPDEQLLAPKQIALLANKTLPTIYNWLDENAPENPVITGSRVAYRAKDVKVWLEPKLEKKRLRSAIRTTRRMAKDIISLRETDSQRYLAILALLENKDEPAKND